MTISTQAMLDYERWKLVLLLRKAAIGTGGFPCLHVLKASGTRASDLPKLADDGFIGGARDGHVIELDTVSNQDNLRSVDLFLTHDGREWLNRSPANLILFTLHARAGRTGMTPRELKNATNVYDRSWYQRLGRAGLIRLVRADGETADMDSGSLDVDAPWLRLHLTTRGAELVTV